MGWPRNDARDGRPEGIAYGFGLRFCGSRAQVAADPKKGEFPMLTMGDGTARTCSGVTRRDFLRVGGLGALGMTLTGPDPAAASGGAADRAVILLMLVGGPSQHETWDPKPDQPAEVRGPFGSIETAVPGVRISEHLPRLARRMDRLAVIRSLHHDAAPIHETGHQLLQTGKLCRPGEEHPHVGSVLARLRGAKNDLPPFMAVPGPIGNTGVGISHGQGAGPLGTAYDPFYLGADPASSEYDPLSALGRARRFLDETPGPTSARSSLFFSRPARNAFDLASEPEAVRDAYGRTTFGQSCLLARRLVESGVRLVTVNMFETVFHALSWDCHGSRPFSTLEDYASTLLPTFDRAFSALLDDLEARGLLDTTLIVATGEFGRTPKLNASGGRDHWPSVWSAAMAGGGVRGGQVIGSSDPRGAEPSDRPVAPAELVATMYRSLGIDPARNVEVGEGRSVALIEDAREIAEAFA
jgi:hypothetical protein